VIVGNVRSRAAVFRALSFSPGEHPSQASRLTSGAIPHQHLLRVFVDDEQLGLLSSVQIKSSSFQSFMEIRIGLLEGLRRMSKWPSFGVMTLVVIFLRS
jgi:hypothetical protein